MSRGGAIDALADVCAVVLAPYTGDRWRREPPAASSRACAETDMRPRYGHGRETDLPPAPV
jgi:hypothetical protein